MNPIFMWVLLTAGLFLGMILLMEVGRSLGARLRAKEKHPDPSGFGILEGALFGLMGLILAFSFSGAAARFDTRRQVIVEEANCISTAYLRIDVLAPQAQPALREEFRQYVEARLSAYRAAPDFAKAEAEIRRSTAIQQEIWRKAVAALFLPASPQAPMLVLPALNEMFDIANTHYMAMKLHPPQVIYLLMGALILICSLLAGFEMGFNKVKSRMHIFAFAVLLAMTVYTIIDLEFPRVGILNIKAFDQALVDVRNSM